MCCHITRIIAQPCVSLFADLEGEFGEENGEVAPKEDKELSTDIVRT